VFRRLLGVAALQQQERHTIVGSAEAVVHLQRPLVVPDRLLGLAGLGKGYRHIE
jgi:hypothetical protein